MTFASNYEEQHLKLLTNNRVDFIFQSELAMKKNIQKYHLLEKDFKKTEIISTTFTEYLAANLDTDQNLIKRLQLSAKSINLNKI